MAHAELGKNQLVVFDDFGKVRKVDRLGVFWSEKHQAWCVLSDAVDAEGYPVTDDNGKRVVLYSNTIIEKPARKTNRKPFTPSKETCTVWIHPCGSTEKAYQIEDGWNGMWGKGRKEWYKYIAKSVCYVDEEGRIFAPTWAVR